jgi:hypothetical protein
LKSWEEETAKLFKKLSFGAQFGFQLIYLENSTDFGDISLGKIGNI